MATNPTLLSMPIAENGTKNTIPETQATPGNGLMSQSTGFPAECSLPLGAGGVAPDRADFNGAFNLLSGVAFMAQKGFTFNYDATQDYYKGCVVIDPNDGNRYLCIADMTAGTIAPSADTTGDYWILYPVGVINKRDVITTSGTYTAPVAGWYKITVKGGGGGGAGGTTYSGAYYSSASGGEGGTTIAYEKMSAGDTATIVIGAGGAGGAVGGYEGANGGDSTVTINLNTYTGGGGGGGARFDGDRTGGVGGSGTIPGAPGQYGNVINGVGQGGKSGGGSGGSTVATSNGINGGGGAGGASISSNYAGGAGGAGYCWMEYFDPSLN